MRVLLSHGADVAIELPSGLTALDLAIEARREQQSANDDRPQVDSVYLLQEAEDGRWEDAEEEAAVQAQEQARAELMRATFSSSASCLELAKSLLEIEQEEEAGAKTIAACDAASAWL